MSINSVVNRKSGDIVLAQKEIYNTIQKVQTALRARENSSRQNRVFEERDVGSQSALRGGWSIRTSSSDSPIFHARASISCKLFQATWHVFSRLELNVIGTHSS